MSGLIGRLLPLISAILAITLAVSLIYSKGKRAGRLEAEAAYEEVLEKARAALAHKSAEIDEIATKQLVADQLRHTTHQEIIRERTQIIDRPIYRNQCIDADGLRILDDIAANAHGEDPAASDDRPAAATENAAQP